MIVPLNPKANTPTANGPRIIFTHHKCATMWLSHILQKFSRISGRSFFQTPCTDEAMPQNLPVPDMVLLLNSSYDFCAQAYLPCLGRGTPSPIHVIRNPLDLIVSAYYSHRNTHAVDEWPELAIHRKVLLSLDKVDGMIATWNFLERFDFMGPVLGPLFCLRRWNFADPRIRTVRMEDLTGDFTCAQRELQDLLGSDLSAILSQFTFETMSGGRPQGVVDDQHHYRSGKPGQWIHEMDPSLVRVVYHAYQPIFDTYYPEVCRSMAQPQGR
ncbi:MAG: sulfotransferase domain-containing protein [Chthoniobacter sp.]|nr:sulfotransferase domain-containing protein [Chthoniobacter sp.]